ncbi:hypothetical protein KM043_006433 [Ampulex compressa]|nr:hypothetical protein KM043_006433 [Ampulex compressa]
MSFDWAFGLLRGQTVRISRARIGRTEKMNWAHCPSVVKRKEEERKRQEGGRDKNRAPRPQFEIQSPVCPAHPPLEEPRHDLRSEATKYREVSLFQGQGYGIGYREKREYTKGKHEYAKDGARSGESRRP